jgi:DNA-binding XRE family transcriptional regulator
MRDSRGYSVHIQRQIEAADPSQVAVQLAQHCVAHNISVLTVAKAVGTSKQSIYAWFSGRHRPSPVFAERVAALLERYRRAAAV